MRIAYFIAVHKNPGQVTALFDLIYDLRDVFLFHVDKKAARCVHDAVGSLANGRRNVYCLDTIEVTWGGWSQCRVELAALRYLCREPLRWDYFINLSGQDLPIKPVHQIRTYLKHLNGANFVDVRPVGDLPTRLKRIVKRRYWCLCLEWHGKARRLPIPIAPFIYKKINYYGSSWHMLSRPFCSWIVDTAAWEELGRYLRFTRSPDECLVQELIMSSPFKHTLCRDNKRLAIFEEKPNPKILRMQDLDQIQASGAFFGRKFDMEIDADIVDAIDKYVTS